MANANYIKDMHFNWENFLIIVRDNFSFHDKECCLEMFI